MESMVKFKVSHADIKGILSQMKFIYVDKKHTKRLINCKITLRDGVLEFDAHGYIFTLKVKSKGGVQFSIPYPRLQLIMSTANGPDVVFIVREGEVQINNTYLHVPTTFFRNLSPIRKITLSVNSNDRELLLLPYMGYSKIEIS